MFFIYGKRKVKIKFNVDEHQHCGTCGSFGVDVVVFRAYFHIFFIPIFPNGLKEVYSRCSHCGERVWVREKVKLYEKDARTPIYFYTGLILIGVLIAWLVIDNIGTQKEKAILVARPKVGDVYAIRRDKKETTGYFFLRLTQIKGDTVFAWHNNLVYNSYVSQFNGDDFFVSGEELVFTKKQLQEMLDKGEINDVTRGYRSEEGFDRIK